NWKDFTLEFSTKFTLKEDYTTALKTMKNHTKRKPLDFEAHYFLAFVYYFDKKWKDAKESFEKFMINQKDRKTLEVDYFIAACENN
ncbi:MAG: hypothetical protein KAR20_03215, partial [Candidatus Heimdallarchaeota archaeon]|nr:hypothetical protein [Candidatus Heimdallarchaeota archaeon]